MVVRLRKEWSATLRTFSRCHEQRVDRFLRRLSAPTKFSKHSFIESHAGAVVLSCDSSQRFRANLTAE